MRGVKLRINEVLEENGKSIKWLSDALGITYANTNNIVNNKAKPSLDRLDEIANILEVPIADLIEEPAQKGENTITCPNCGAALELKKKE